MGKRSGLRLLTEEFWAKRKHVLAHELTRKWLEHLCVRDYADKTVEAYATDLEGFLAFCEGFGVCEDFESVQLDVVDAYFKSMERLDDGRGKVVRFDSGMPLSKKTIARRAASLKQWFAYFVLNGSIARNPLAMGSDEISRSLTGYHRKKSAGRTYLRRPDATPWIPSDAEYDRLAAYLRNPMLCSERDRFMMLLSYECALRASELVDALVEDFNFETMTMYVLGKGGKSANVPFSDRLVEAWPRYLAYRAQVRRGPGHLFVSESNRNYGQQLTTSTWSNRVAEIRDAVNLPRFHPHTMRHLSITDLARVGMPPLALKAFARHESLRTTDLYIQLSAGDIRHSFARVADLRPHRVMQLIARVSDVE